MDRRHALGWLPDVPKPNDYTVEHEKVAPLLARTRAPRVTHLPTQQGKGAKLAKKHVPLAPLPPPPPPYVDLRAWCPPIEDQGYLGSCTANAAATLLEYFELRAFGRHVDASRLFIYKAERNLLGWVGDTGAFLRTAMEALVLFGAPPERYWPYDGRAADENPRFDVEPPGFCYAFGSNYQAIKYFRLDPAGASTLDVLAAIRASLAAGFPAMFGFPVYPEFDAPLPGGLIPFPAGSGYRGGHAICAVGYNDDLMIGGTKGALLIRNSWGAFWGEGGYGWMSYRYVTEGLANDWWTMVSAEWVETAQFD
jgi:C1A family cysteine protease